MDTTDPHIVFDGEGVCDHCSAAFWRLKNSAWNLSPDAKIKALDQLVKKIKVQGRGKRYDCVIGVSGGVDSTYVAFMAKKNGLRPLAVHFDNGWNSELAVANIEKTLKRLGIDLYTFVVDWEEFRDLQLSFLKASTPDSEIPTDHGIFSLLFHVARKEGLRYILAGTNAATESIMPLAWSRGHNDWKYIQSVQRLFGTVRLTTFPHRTLWSDAFMRVLLRIQWVHFLDFFEYNKANAEKYLEKEIHWKPYGGKHYESIYTRFFQGYILPKKFGIDKRKAHLSSIIMSGQRSRAQALAELNKPPLDSRMAEEDRVFVIQKLGLTEQAFDEIMAAPPRSFQEFPSYGKSWYFRWLTRIYRSTLGSHRDRYC